jgi:NAD(P)-dependent dehydrogenase (short-subunit alcohol dehydrogenase family)
MGDSRWSERVAARAGSRRHQAWDSLGDEGKADYFEHFRTHNPARRIGTIDDITEAVLFAMTNELLTGTTLRVDGGEPLT